jgi:hypothetical protein
MCNIIELSPYEYIAAQNNNASSQTCDMNNKHRYGPRVTMKATQVAA